MNIKVFLKSFINKTNDEISIRTMPHHSSYSIISKLSQFLLFQISKIIFFSLPLSDANRLFSSPSLPDMRTLIAYSLLDLISETLSSSFINFPINCLERDCSRLFIRLSKKATPSQMSWQTKGGKKKNIAAMKSWIFSTNYSSKYLSSGITPTSQCRARTVPA